MMLDLLSPSNYSMYNIKLAQVFGLHAAIYISELLNINDKALRKDVIKDDYFTLDRKYITSRTTFTEEEQLQIEDGLIKVGVIDRSASRLNVLSLNIQALTTLMSCDDTVVISNIKKALKLKTGTKATQRQAQANNLKSFINTPNDELHQAYEDWIDGVYSNPKGFLSKKAIQIFQNEIEKFANHNLDLALEVIDIATLHGYRDPEWAISRYLSNSTVKYRSNIAPNQQYTQVKPELSETEVF